MADINYMLARSTYDVIVADRGKIFTCVLLLLLVGAGSAHASAAEPLQLAEQTAESYWGNVPCQGQIAISWQANTPTPALAGTEVEAWVTFETPLGNTNFLAPAATYTDCTVNIATKVWPNYAATVSAYPEFCQMMVHEFGHFEGYADSTSYAPSDIRYPLLTQANLPTVCMQELSSSLALPETPGQGVGRSSAGPDTKPLRTGKIHCFEVNCAVAARRTRARAAGHSARGRARSLALL